MNLPLFEISTFLKQWYALMIEPVFPEKRQAINYAQNRASFRSGEIRILGSNGIVGRTISLDQLGGRSFKGKIPRCPGVE